uniref:Uncharacterized protein n=1 Tax=viral metagenome TaxID=1070528 RepID=A0A6C0KG81_9ZZZZ
MVSTHKQQTILYSAIGLIFLFVVMIYAIDYLFGIMKPDYIKINGKIDKNKQFLYSLGISLVIFLIIIFILYEIVA